jgi:leucyl-tRNA---protein transferase
MGVVVSQYDEQCAREYAQLESELERHFVEVTVDCPYQLPEMAIFYQGLFAPLPDRMMEIFLAAGYRRNGNCLYAMHCPDCRACVPIRLHPTTFTLNRNQRRVTKKNQDLDIEFSSLELSEENVTLCQKFLSGRYPHKNNDARSYYEGFFLNRIVSGMEIRFRLQGRLVGNAIVDVGQNWMNAVYFYFDPDYAPRSLGTFNILTLVKTCLDLNINYLYLGYYIEEVAAMNYKAHFSPRYPFLDGKWQRQGKE